MPINHIITHYLYIVILELQDLTIRRLEEKIRRCDVAGAPGTTRRGSPGDRRRRSPEDNRRKRRKN